MQEISFLKMVRLIPKLMSGWWYFNLLCRKRSHFLKLLAFRQFIVATTVFILLMKIMSFLN